MNCYLVAGTNVSAADLSERFGQYVYPVNALAWVVATDSATTSDVAEAIGMNDQAQRGGIVVRVGDYYGYFDKALWEKIEAWRREA